LVTKLKKKENGSKNKKIIIYGTKCLAESAKRGYDKPIRGDI